MACVESIEVAGFQIEGPLIIAARPDQNQVCCVGLGDELMKVADRTGGKKCKFHKFVTESLENKRAVGRTDLFGLRWGVSSF